MTATRPQRLVTADHLLDLFHSPDVEADPGRPQEDHVGRLSDEGQVAKAPDL
jgi:hypothetical protein